MAITWKTIERWWRVWRKGESVCGSLCEPRLGRILGKLKIDLPYDWAVSFLDINPKGNEITASETCAPMFTMARLTRAEIPQRSLMGKKNCIDCGMEIQWNISQPLKQLLWDNVERPGYGKSDRPDTHKSVCSHSHLKHLKQRAWQMKKSAELIED